MLPKGFAHVAAAAERLGGDIRDVETKVIGLDHHVMGKRLCETWSLPRAVRDVCWLHNTPVASHHDLAEHTDHDRLIRLVTLADGLVRRQHLGFSGNHDLGELDPLGLTDAELAAATDTLHVTVEERSEALLPDVGGEGGSVFRRALVQTSRQLGKVAGDLAARNRDLRRQGDFFDLAAAFTASLRPDATVTQTLAAVATNAAAALGTGRAAAFAGTGEVVSVAGGDVKLPAGTDREPTPLPGTVGVLAVAGDAVEWAAAEASPHVGGPVLWHVGFASETRPVGGVLVGAAASFGEEQAERARGIAALSAMWGLAVRSAQVRAEARDAAEAAARSSSLLKAAEEDALRARTLMSLGEIAAGAAHEMNNPLMVISGRSQLLFQQLKQTQPNHAAKAKLIFERSQELSEMITQLMEFAKPTRPDRRPVAVADVLAEAQRLAAERDPDGWRGRRIEADVPGDLPGVEVDLPQVADALAEILTNAQQHTPAAGRIAVTARGDGGRVVIRVADNGSGMAANVRAHACDPFFSAQSSGRRRGMGLAKALRRIDASGGWLKIDSQPGRGTIVQVQLPAADVDAGPARPAAQDAA